MVKIIIDSPFFFLYFGSFFVFRDWKDVIRFKFIEKPKIINGDETLSHNNSVFNKISKEDINFFKIPRILLYPFGIFLTGFSFTMVAYGTNFIPEDIFLLDYESVVLLGYFIGAIAGGLIGIDWLRIFRKFYPEIYQELHYAMKQLENT